MRPLVRFTLGHTVFFNLIFVLLMVAGAFCFFNLPLERYPNVEMGKVLISTYYPGASSTDVETLITTKIEEALEDLEDVEFIRSKSYRERSSILVKFIDDADYQFLYRELRFKVLGILDELPPEVDPPVFKYIDVRDWLPVINVNLAGDRSNRALSLMAEDMQVSLRQIEGVHDVELTGEFIREFHVVLDPDRMKALGITFEETAEALRRANVFFPAGDFADGSGEYVIRVDEKFRSREEVVNSIIRKDLDGSFVTVNDIIRDARLSYRDPFVISSINGENCVTLKVLKTDEGNAVTIAEHVRKTAEEFRPILEKEGVRAILTQDSTVYINDSVTTLGWNMLLGICLVSVILWYFMGIRNAGLTTLGIPFSFLVTMLIMYFTGNSLNEITLFCFVLVAGIIVDDAIVVVENIYRHCQEGFPLRDSIINGTSEVMVPVISATSTTVAAFLPMLIMTGATGEFFAQVPRAVTFAILASLLECLFILPIHYLDFGPRPASPADAGEVHDNTILKFFHALTVRIVSVTLRFPFISIGTVSAAFIIAIAILGVSVTGKMPLIKIKFFPDDYKYYYINLRYPGTTPVEAVSEQLKEISRFVMEGGPGMAGSAAAFAGFYINEDYEQIFGNNLGTVIVTLPAKDHQHFADFPENDPIKHLDFMRRRLEEKFTSSGCILWVRPEKDGPPTGRDINARIMGTNPDAVKGLSREIMHFLETDPEISGDLIDLQDDQGLTGRVFHMDIRQDRAHEYGISTLAAARLAASVLDGRIAGRFRLADEEVDLKLMVDTSSFRNPVDALDIAVMEHPSGPIRLRDLVRTYTNLEPDFLTRYQGERAVTITANIKPGADISTPLVIDRLKSYYRTVREEFPGAVLSFGGEFESTRRSFKSLIYAFAIAILIMYVILATQFRSYLQPLIILSAVVFSLIGVIFGKLFTQSLFTVNSFIAVVGVTGIVVNDSLVLIDFINRKHRSGMSRREAIYQGIKIRLRPILLTTMTTTLGLLPMAVGIPSYSIVWGSMATTFVTGLATATALTLFIVPVQWELIEKFKDASGGGSMTHPPVSIDRPPKIRNFITGQDT
ncbi:MAG TPA: efflux RND transporter permease subunit [Thermodesulfobacteriaceae bacterium]|nr:efflux RND transporter permease subunit [Thermodesulfobacteriaceae bacterium]